MTRHGRTFFFLTREDSTSKYTHPLPEAGRHSATVRNISPSLFIPSWIRSSDA